MPLTEIDKLLGKIEPERLLQEVEALMRTMPPQSNLRDSSEEVHAWFGRLRAVVEAWDTAESTLLTLNIGTMRGPNSNLSNVASQAIQDLLHHARAALQLKTNVSPSAVIDHGKVFDYFNELRKIVEAAVADIFFVDPYLDADFAERYLPSVKSGVGIRLLARERLNSLIPAVRLFNSQHGSNAQVRSAPGFHDRFVFVDADCYQSGASFKDGGKNAPTVISQVRDGAAQLRHLYDVMWLNGDDLH
jgi:hypothetical protein